MPNDYIRQYTNSIDIYKNIATDLRNNVGGMYNTLLYVVLLGNRWYRLFTTTSALQKLFADLCDNLAHCNNVGGIYCTLPIGGFNPATNVQHCHCVKCQLASHDSATKPLVSITMQQCCRRRLYSSCCWVLHENKRYFLYAMTWQCIFGLISDLY